MSASLNCFSLGNPASCRYLLSLLPWRVAGHKGKTCHPAVMERRHLAPTLGLWSGWVTGLAPLAAGHLPSLNPHWSDRPHGTSGPLLPWVAGPGVSVWRVITYRPWGVICALLARSGVLCHCTSVHPVRKSPYLGILSCYALAVMFLWAGDAGGKWGSDFLFKDSALISIFVFSLPNLYLLANHFPLLLLSGGNLNCATYQIFLPMTQIIWC